MAYDDDNIGDCASSRSDVESLYNHMVDRKVALEKKLRTTSQKLNAVQIKINQFRSKVEVNNIELEEMKEKFFDHKKLESNKYFDPIKKLVLSANHKRKMHLTVLKKKDGSYCIKFLPIIGVIQTLDVGILKFAVIDLKSDSKRPVYFKKYIKYGINIRDTKKFTLEQLKQFTEMAYKAYVDWLKPIIET
ncbi:1890_t:CDS:2, partial [Funneliformis mosseae]